MITFTPDLDGQRPLRILCLGAHSDDIEIGCGGSVLQFIAGVRPVEVQWMVFSGAGRRTEEANRSAAHWLQSVPSKRIVLHDFRDGYFPHEWAAIKDVFEEIRKGFEPDLVFTHFRDDLHQDHRTINQLTWNTFRNHLVLEYEIPKFDGDMRSPDVYVAVTEETARAKASALMRFFGSQGSKHWFCEELFLGLMRIRGMEACSPSGYAEGFYGRKICVGIPS